MSKIIAFHFTALPMAESDGMKPAGILAVLALGEVNDVAAYRAVIRDDGRPVERQAERWAGFVHSQGQKLFEDEARRLFAFPEGCTYRP